MDKFNNSRTHKLGIREIITSQNFYDKMTKYCDKHKTCCIDKSCEEKHIEENKEEHICICEENQEQQQEKNNIEEINIKEPITIEIKPKFTNKMFIKSKSIKW
jgi:D-alanine-D-alanine ligase-like ATP-grasp enzyme